MQNITVTKAKRHLNRVLDAVTQTGTCVLITRHQRPLAVIMSWADFNSAMETLHLLSNLANAAHLAQSIAQYRQDMTQELQ